MALIFILAMVTAGGILQSVKAEAEIEILFAGDFMDHMDEIKAAYNRSTGLYNYTSCFTYVKSLMSTPDLTIGNLETPLGIKPYSGFPRFNSPLAYAEALKNIGVDAVTTANNHAEDQGVIGIERTIRYLDFLGIMHTGTFLDERHKSFESPLILEKNGFKIALLSYTFSTNHIPNLPPVVVNYLEEGAVLNDVARAKLKNPDQIIAFLHWGTEYHQLQSAYQERWFQFFKSIGINIVIGSHPHVVQPMKYNEMDNSLVVYSLGNFLSHQRMPFTDGGAVFRLVLEKNNNGKVRIKRVGFDLTWVYQVITPDGLKHFTVLPVKRFEKHPELFTDKEAYAEMMRYARGVRSFLSRENINVSEE
ncbi:PGA biosynthesis protein CapA-like [Tubulanus polymorphus]|uniref:PGA biosynthesis protein CapA-like n=1 Tax=Tubulanus polymorphus TaxID=672921 RepID=UPI003DA42D13